MQSNHLFTKKIEEQLHDLSLLLTEFQYLCNSPRRELRKINEFKQIITNFFNSTHADELVSCFSILSNRSAQDPQDINYSSFFSIDIIFSDLENLFILLDQIGRITYSNKTITSFWGIEQETVIGKPLGKLAKELQLSTSTQINFDAVLKQTSVNNRTESYRFETLLEDGAYSNPK